MRKKHLLILGSGQLAMMLSESADREKVYLQAIGNTEEDPVSSAVDRLSVASLNSAVQLSEFFGQAERIIFENEFINPEIMREALGQGKDSSDKFFPPPEVMAKCGDKLVQKLLLTKANIPTAPYMEILHPDDLEAAYKEFSGGFVLKKAKGGYDGKGNFMLRSKDDWQDATDFLEAALAAGVRVYCEKLIPFKEEIAQVSAQGETIVHFPTVKTIQENGVCSIVTGPIDQKISQEAQTLNKRIKEAFELSGVFATEYFLTEDAELIVNEIAPRVHNSGHITMDSCQVSQFDLHIKAALEEPLETPRLKTEQFAMFNILGPSSYSGPVSTPVLNIPGAKLYWYFKKDSRPGRKLGHINVIGSSESIEQTKAEVKAWLDQWAENLQA